MFKPEPVVIILPSKSSDAGAFRSIKAPDGPPTSILPKPLELVTFNTAGTVTLPLPLTVMLS